MTEAVLDTRAFERAMRAAPERLYVGLRAAIGAHHRRHLAAFRGGRFHAGRSGAGVQTRSGALGRSFGVEIRGTDLDSLIVLTRSSGVPYARIQEAGGIIRPRRSRYLAIPLGAAKTPSGVLRAPPRAWADTFVRRIGGGRLLIMQQRKGGAVPLFLLTRGPVTLRPRLGFMSSFSDRENELLRAVNAAVRHALTPVQS